MECFICSDRIQGDPAFIERHINQCLDQQSSSVGSSGSGSSRDVASRHEPFAQDRFSQSRSINLSSHESVCQALESSLDAQSALALSVSMQADEDERLESYQRQAALVDDASARCPLCDNTWSDIAVGETEQARSEHVASCMEGLSALEAEVLHEGIAHASKFDWLQARKAKPIQGTPGLVKVLARLLVHSHKVGGTKSAYLATEHSMHIGTQISDLGWGCGYRNMQMIFAAARHLEAYSRIHGDRDNIPPVPSVANAQRIIEQAWEDGYDPPGAAHFGKRLVGKRRWIGTTEVYTALTWLGIRVRIVDFPAANGPGDGAHVSLLKWILNYFAAEYSPPLRTKHGLSDDEDEDGSSDAFDTLMKSGGRAIKLTGKQPLYLQHQGHSRTVVGIVVGSGGEHLLLFDPGKRISHTMASAAAHEENLRMSKTARARQRVKLSSSQKSSDSSTGPKGSSSPPAHARGGSGTTSATDSSHAAFYAEMPGFERIWKGKSSATGPNGARSSSASDAGLSSADLARHTKLLEPYRVSLTSLSRKTEYQILYVEDGPALNVNEKLSRREIKSAKGC